MTLLGLKIGVLGGGIGGLTAALALAQRGAQVTVLEQAEAIKEVGAGIQVSPNGFCVLRALGLGDALRAKAVKGEAVELRDYKAGRVVTRLDLGLLDADQEYFFAHRADLIDILVSACRESGVQIRLLQKAENVVPGAVPKVTLANGSQFTADLIIGADGLHSVVRKALNGTTAPFFTRQTAWRATVPNTMDHPPLTRLTMGPKRHMVTYPIRGGDLVNIVAVQERMDWVEEGWSHKDDPNNLRAAFSDFGGPIPALLDQVTETGLWGLFRHPVAPKWFGENVAILGDAAHPTLPFMAQGAVMAMEDAWVLADCLAMSESTEVGLAAYQAKRYDRCVKVVAQATGSARKYHLSFPPMRWVAHTGLSALGASAPKKLLGQFDWIYRFDVTENP
ncbi:FAD-dependent monooxygenase [Cognatishimia activa]|uniref:3-hydroxybenzoate 6-hydroxylase 1 n=1 Tax=Cognatishimia activa TaxID=1715691 RepID=A0A0P1IZJ6_9RHOB|nr:FAD-dependent monooxygenase [Cognatishimia activa]CUJ33401.1 3-hydroxybenzoate 6-hydroxylase 1 [Cognatishimia activa]CUK27111.1 3-hydroxybenzoate 6-hydroxylase 1 [Cognatishimia activa]